MDSTAVPDRYSNLMNEIADEIYSSRKRFFRNHFDGYVEDTYYYVPDGRYYCWPAHSEGRFIGFTELLPAEKEAVQRLQATGFRHVATGLNRVACETPEDSTGSSIVKFGRCGMGEVYGTGRKKNLIERQISTLRHDLPIVPCQYCHPNGKYAIYPMAESIEDRSIDRKTSAELLAKVENAGFGLRQREIEDTENLGYWRGEVRILDYSDSVDFQYPMGVPDHVDGDSVVRRVDQLRRRNEKPDIKTPGELVEPNL